MPDLTLDKFTPLWSYYDWAITGANCVVYLTANATELTVKRLLENVPTIAVGYEIQQNKTPLYGYNDTGPRMIMRGQRLVSGQLIIAHREVGYLQKVLRKADPILYNSKDTLDLKETNKLKYWNTRSWESTFKDPQRKNFANEEDQYNIFYAHPNFDISIVYGTGDEVGKATATAGGYIDLRAIVDKKSEWYNNDPNQYNDVNPLYRPDHKSLDLKRQRETISSVQLTGLSKSVAADGEIIVEAYSFLAVDVLYQ
jgi:hypothetical protein